MTSDPRYHHLRELSWRRKLTEAEEAELRVWLATHPDAQTDWEAEAVLAEALGRLPDAPVASNFTARVIQAVEREEAADARREKGWSAWAQIHRWLPKAAIASLLVGAVGFFSYHRHQLKMVHREELLNSVEKISEVSSLPSPEILKDFEAIRALKRTGPDEELLALLQ